MTAEMLSPLNRFITSVLTPSAATAAGDGGRTAPVITIARDHGAGGEVVGQAVARALGVGYYDKELLDLVVAAARTDKTLMRHLDEKATPDSLTTLLTRLWSPGEPEQEYRRCLAKAILRIADVGGVIIGRGAHMVLADRPDILRVRIIGSAGPSALRLAEGDRTRAPALRPALRTINRERTQFLWETFRVRLNDPSHFDLVINTDRFPDLDAVAQVVIEAFHQRFPTAPSARKAA